MSAVSEGRERNSCCRGGTASGPMFHSQEELFGFTLDNSYKGQTTHAANCAVVVQSALKGCTFATFIIAVLLSLLAEVTGTGTSDYCVDLTYFSCRNLFILNGRLGAGTGRYGVGFGRC